MKIAIICVGVVTLRFRTVPPHGSSNKTRVNRAMPHHSPNCMFSFYYMNITHLHAKYRQKNTLLADYCDSSTMFICLCETFLHKGILDSEVQIPGYIIVRSDRVSRPGGGVCLYLRKNLIYKINLTYSNSVCDLLIVKNTQSRSNNYSSV